MTRFVKYPIVLSGDSKRLASLELPIDLTQAEAEHIVGVIRTIAMPDDSTPEEGS